MFYHKLCNNSFNALMCAILMMLFSILPQNYKALQMAFAGVEQVAQADPVSNQADQESQDNGSQSSTPTIVEEEMIHHQSSTLAFIIPFNISRYSLTNEYYKGIVPDTPLPPPDLPRG